MEDPDDFGVFFFLEMAKRKSPALAGLSRFQAG
jgi:hypothetical protein